MQAGALAEQSQVALVNLIRVLSHDDYDAVHSMLVPCSLMITKCDSMLVLSILLLRGNLAAGSLTSRRLAQQQQHIIPAQMDIMDAF